MVELMGAPVGNTYGAKRNRMLTDQLRRELTQHPEDVVAIARRTIESAKAGDSWAQTLIYERIDGKVPQAIVGDDDEPAIKFGRVIRTIVDPVLPDALPQPTDR